MELSPRSRKGLRRMDPSEVPEGMDPSCTYRIEVRTISARARLKEFPGGYVLTKYVESDTTNMKDFLEEICESYMGGYNEKKVACYFDPQLNSYIQLTTDQELMAMFDKFASTKYIDLNLAFVNEKEASSMPEILSKFTGNAPPPSETTEAIDTATGGNSCNLSKPDEAASICPAPSSCKVAVMCDTSYLANPFPMFEHVGVNEEAQYGKDVVAEVETGNEGSGSEGSEGSSSEDSSSEEGSESESGESSSEEEGEQPTNEPGDEEDWVARDAMPDEIPQVAYDKDDPPMHVGAIYPCIEEFKIALSQHAIKNEFEFNTEKSDTERVRVYCAAKHRGCQWRIHASTIEDKVTVKVKVNPKPHSCGSRRRSRKMKNATQQWISEQVLDWVRDDAAVGAKELQRRLKDKFKVEINYKRVHAGRQIALDKVYGTWHDSFDQLYRWKAEVEKRSPGSVVIIEYHTYKEQRRFMRMFVALKACVDGFLQGCRPYLAIDSTFLTGMFRGQLATACSVDGHNWLFPVVFAVMEAESGDNWKWFMEKLHDVIGDPTGLAICTDAGKGLEQVKEVFSTAEHRECMRHLVTNFRKKYTGKVFNENLWPAAYAWLPEVFDEHMGKMVEAKPEIQHYLNKWHPNLWMRSKFSTQCKVDYVTNNIAESFNKWISKLKGLHVVDLVDMLRQKIMVKFAERRRVAAKMTGIILPHIKTELDQKSFGLAYNIVRSGDNEAEITGNQWTFTKKLEPFRHIVDLEGKTCTCREWQVSGKPCLHAIAFITYLRDEPFDNYVDSYYSVEKFKKTYAGNVPACVHKKFWPKSDHGFFLHPPFLRKTAGRPRNQRIKGSHEKGAKKPKNKGTRHKCPICDCYGHHWQSCKEGNPEHKEALAKLAAQMKEQKKRATKKAIAQALGRSEGTSVSTARSACASNSVEGPANLAVVPVCDEPSTTHTSSTVGSPSKLLKKVTTRKVKIADVSKEEKKKEAKKKEDKKKKEAKKKEKKKEDKKKKEARKQKKIAEAATTSSKRKRTAEPSTPSKRKRPAAPAPPDSPAMSTRSKKLL